MDTRQVGTAAEIAITKAFIDQDVPVYIPFGSFGPVDLIIDLGVGDPVRVQVKNGRVRKGSVLFNTCSTDHGQGRRPYRGLADVLAVHVPEIDRQFVVPVVAVPEYVASLRVTPTRNNQLSGVRFAADHELPLWVERQRELATAA